KLLIPGCVERVGKINTLTITADFHHLRSAAERDMRFFRMGRFPDNPADLNDRREFRAVWYGDIVAAELSGTPAGNVEPFVVQGEINVGDQRRNGFEPL